MMRDAGGQRPQFLDGLDLAHLGDQLLQRLNCHILSLVWEIRLKFQLRHREGHRPEPAKCLVPRLSVARLERTQVHAAVGGSSPRIRSTSVFNVGKCFSTVSHTISRLMRK